MKKFLFTLCAISMTTATAQQTVKAAFSPVTIDGRVTQNGLVTINGKSYVSVDALSAAKVTLLKANSLGIYNFSAKANIPVKLSGCMNEWLTDGTTRVRVSRVGDPTSTDPKYGHVWNIALDFMTSKNSDSVSSIFAPNQQEVTMQKGQILAPAKDSFSKIYMEDRDIRRGETPSIYVQFNMPDISVDNPPTKLVMMPTAKAQVKAPWVFDLTCKK